MKGDPPVWQQLAGTIEGSLPKFNLDEAQRMI
jgi:hypothetical protein